MIEIRQYENRLAQELPETYRILQDAHLIVDPRVYQINVHGSRGPAGGYSPESDLDLSLMVDDSGLDSEYEHCPYMRAILLETLERWESRIRPDIAVVFDQWGCGLPCFSDPSVDPGRCPHRGIECFGVVRCAGTQTGYCQGMGLQVRRLRPCMPIWRRH